MSARQVNAHVQLDLHRKLARFTAAQELVRANDALREAERVGFHTPAHRDRLRAAEAVWDELKGSRRRTGFDLAGGDR